MRVAADAKVADEVNAWVTGAGPKDRGALRQKRRSQLCIGECEELGGASSGLALHRRV